MSCRFANFPLVSELQAHACFLDPPLSDCSP